MTRVLTKIDRLTKILSWVAIVTLGIGLAPSKGQVDQLGQGGNLSGSEAQSETVNRTQTILKLEEYIAPSSKLGNMIRFKKPDGAQDVEIRTIFDEWGKGYTLTPNSKDPNIVEIDIKELGLPEGRYEFKFVIDGEFEDGYNRVLWIDEEGLLVEPKKGRAILRDESHESETLSFLDNNHTFLEITHSGDSWKTRTPLKFESPYWGININELNLKGGTHKYKIIRDGLLEEGADRLLHTTEEAPKKVIIKDPRRTKIIKSEAPSKTLQAINPNTTYLAIKTSADGWAKEYIMEDNNGIWVLGTEGLNLSQNEEKQYDFKFVTSEGLENGENRKLFIDKNNYIVFPKPWEPTIVRTKKPSSILYFKRPLNTKIEVVTNKDGWTKRFESKRVKNQEDIFAINTKEMGLPIGKTEYKFVIDGEFEEGANRLLWLNEEGKIYSPEPKAPVVWDGFEPYPTLRVNDEQVTSLRMKHSGDGWTSSVPFEQIDGIWQLDITKLGLSPGIYEYKLERDYELEPSANRILHIIEDSKHARIYPQSPEVIQAKSPSPLLIVKDPNTKYLAIKHEQDKWENEYPFREIKNTTLEMGKFISPIRENETETKNRETIKFKKPKGAEYVELRTAQNDWTEGYALSSKNNKDADILEIDISRLKLKEGKMEYKFVIDGEFEWGPNRFVWIDKNGLMAEKQPSVQGTDSLWVLDTKDIGLTPGRIEYKLVNSEGIEPFNNRILHISEEGNLEFPLPETPFILNKAKASKTINVLAPNNPDLGLSYNGDNWNKVFKLTRSGDIWSTSNDELKIAPGEYEFKLRIGDEYEPGANRKLSVTEAGEFLFIDPGFLEIDPDVALIKIKAPRAQSLQLRHTEDWEKVFLFEKNTDGEWTLDSRILGIPKNKRIFFKLIADEKTEGGPDRAAYINDAGKFVIEKPPVPEPITTSQEDLKTDDPYFGMIRAVDPDPALSLKGKPEWYNNASIYHLWVPSFRDSTKGSLANDGIGDLRGITEVIESGYFNNLGINAIWLSPIFQSADEDYPKDWMHGYETKDFYEINKNFGTKKDFEGLIKTAHKNNIRIILEFVPNHVGNKHPWFLASSDPSHPNHEKFKDWFIWEKDPIEDFGLKVWHKNPLWTKSDARGMYYYHIFSGYLPDLNYRNPEVIQEIGNIAIYWLNLGVDGFRVDANKYLFENFNNIESGAHNQPETIEFYQELNRITESYGELGYPKVMIAENWTYNSNEIELYGSFGNKKSFDLSLDFMFPHIVKWSNDENTINRIVNHINNDQPKNIKYLRFLTNHDLSAPRAKSYYGQARRLAATLNMLLPGPYVVYYGEEIDMEGNTDAGVRNQFQWDLINNKEQEESGGLNLPLGIGSLLAVGDSSILESGVMPKTLDWLPKDRKTLRFKKPENSEFVEIRSIQDNWATGFPLTSKDKSDQDILEIDLTSLNLREGKVDFKFLIDGEFEEGPNRFVWIDEKGYIAENQPSTLDEYKVLGQFRQKYKEFFETSSFEVVGSGDGSKILLKYSLEGRQLVIVINTKSTVEYASIFTPETSKVTDAKTGAKKTPSKETKGENKELEFEIRLKPYDFGALLIEE